MLYRVLNDCIRDVRSHALYSTYFSRVACTKPGYAGYVAFRHGYKNFVVEYNCGLDEIWLVYNDVRIRTSESEIGRMVAAI